MEAIVNKHGQRVGRKGAATRLRLIQAASDLLEKGTVNLSPGHIASAAGVSSASFYLYFCDIREIELALSRVARDDLLQLIDLLDFPANAADLEDRCLHFVEAYTARWIQHRQVLRLRNFRADAGDADFLQVRSETGMPFIQKIALGIAACCPDPQTAQARAIVFYASLDRLSVAAHQRTNFPTPELMRAEAHVLALLYRH